MKKKLPYQLRRRQLYSLLFFGIALLSFNLGFSHYKKQQTLKIPTVYFISSPTLDIPLSDFDPNLLTLEGWMTLGFSEKQSQTILKYKQLIGGSFTTKEQLKKCYAISEEKYEQLAKHLLLPDNSTTHYKPLNIKEKFNPNHLSQKDWEALGFTTKQAAAILKYKKLLGNMFVSKEQLRACYIISEDHYHQMEKFVLLPQKSPLTTNTKNNNIININKSFDPNDLNLEDWKKLGFSEKQAQVIINYKNNKLKGSFKSLDDLKNCFVISNEMFNAMKPWIKINSNQNPTPTLQETDFSKIDLNEISFKQLKAFGFSDKDAAILIGFRKKLGGFMTKEQVLETYEIDKELANKLINICPLSTENVKRYRLTEAPEEWLKSHPYFKYSADKIMYYRVTYNEDKKIWKLLKLKPEYEKKMRLYILED